MLQGDCLSFCTGISTIKLKGFRAFVSVHIEFDRNLLQAAHNLAAWAKNPNVQDSLHVNIQSTDAACYVDSD